jgi:hypothetical protein
MKAPTAQSCGELTVGALSNTIIKMHLKTRIAALSHLRVASNCNLNMMVKQEFINKNGLCTYKGHREL